MPHASPQFQVPAIGPVLSSDCHLLYVIIINNRGQQNKEGTQGANLSKCFCLDPSHPMAITSLLSPVRSRAAAKLPVLLLWAWMWTIRELKVAFFAGCRVSKQCCDHSALFIRDRM